MITVVVGLLVGLPLVDGRLLPTETCVRPSSYRLFCGANGVGWDVKLHLHLQSLALANNADAVRGMEWNGLGCERLLDGLLFFFFASALLRSTEKYFCTGKKLILIDFATSERWCGQETT